MGKAFTSIVIAIIVTCLIILGLVFSVLLSGKTVVQQQCFNELKEKLDKIKLRACEMNDEDIEFVVKIDMSCVKQIIYKAGDSPHLDIFFKEKDKEYKYDLMCPEGFYGAVFFDFSLAGEINKINIEEKIYNFLVSQNKVKVVFCEGYSEDCKDIKNKEDCLKQIGCSWDETICVGTSKSCYDIERGLCEKQKGCSLI
ncbi:MAG: hypothetical protein QXJ06_00420 [Candidatus Aenigmatarchaeota archaeon]